MDDPIHRRTGPLVATSGPSCFPAPATVVPVPDELPAARRRERLPATVTDREATVLRSGMTCIHASLVVALLAVSGLPAAAADPAAAAFTAAFYRAPFLTEPPLVSETAAGLEAKVVEMTTFPQRLDPRFWNDDRTMRQDVRDRTIAIVGGLFAAMRLRNDRIRVADIELFGSNAAYEWDDRADFGVHVFLNTATDGTLYGDDLEDLDTFIGFYNDKVEVEQESQLTFRGVVVEVVFHAIRGESYSDAAGMPQFSIWSSDPGRSNRWVNTPTKSPDAWDRTVMLARATEFTDRYNRLVKDYFADKAAFACEDFAGLRSDLRKYRGAEIDASGQRSNGNLVYRLLRRLSVNVVATTADLHRECLNIRNSIL